MKPIDYKLLNQILPKKNLKTECVFEISLVEVKEKKGNHLKAAILGNEAVAS